MADALANRVLAHVRGQEPLLVDLLRELVEAESPSRHPAVHRQARHIFMAALSELDYHVVETGTPKSPRHVYGRPAVRERFAPSQLVLGHYDTVWPVGTIAERPFEVDGNIIRGPGVFDMKGGLVQLIIALRTLRELALEPTVVPVVFVNADEEIGSRSSTRFIRLLARHAVRAFVLEPALGDEGSIKTERKGIGRFTVTAYGKAAHAGLDPEAGASAILELSHVIQKLFALNDPSTAASSRTSSPRTRRPSSTSGCRRLRTETASSTRSMAWSPRCLACACASTVQ